MFYTNKSIRLHTRCLAYLEFIQRTNNRYEDERSKLARYDACKDIFAPIRLMNERYQIVEQIQRWENLSKWLTNRYQDVFYKLGEANLVQLRKEIKGTHPLTANLI